MELCVCGQVNCMNEEVQVYKECVILEVQGEVVCFSELLFQFEKVFEVICQCIYFEIMEQVFFNISKIMVDSGEGGNNIMYLLFDKIMDGQNFSSIIINCMCNMLEGLQNVNSGNMSGMCVMLIMLFGLCGDSVCGGR